MLYSSRNDRTIQELSSQSDGWAKRLETLEKEMMMPTDSSNDPAVNRMSINVVDRADSARSTRDSILSLYGHRSYYQKILDPREAPFEIALEMQADYARVSRIIEDHLEDDLQPAEAASEAVDEGLDVHANASTKPADSSEELEIFHAQRYPCRARAMNRYRAPPDLLHWLSYEENEVLQVATFAGTTWQVRKNTGEEGLAGTHNLTPHYPYLARARFNLDASFILKDEILLFSKMEYYPRYDVYLRPWRKKTGETGIAPDEAFLTDYPLDKSLPPLPRPKPGEFNSISVFDDYTPHPFDALNFTETET